MTRLLAAIAVVGLLALGGASETARADALLTQGDVDCDGGISTRDNQALLRKVLQQNPLSQTQPCTPIGDPFDIAGTGERPWGDMDCDGEISTRDNQGLLRSVLQQNALSQTEPCPDIGEAAEVLLLNEVLFLPAAGGQQFAEIKNTGGGAVDLAGVYLANAAGEEWPMPAGATSLGAGEVSSVELGTAFLDFESDALELRRGDASLDRVAWGDEHPNAVNLTRGGVALPLEQGTAIGRHPASSARGPGEWLPAPPGVATPGTQNAAPGMGAMLPLDGALVADDVALRWYAVPGATAYRVQVSADSGFAAPLIDETVDVPALDAGGLAEAEYHWRVEPLSPSGGAGFSPPQSVTVTGAGLTAAAGAGPGVTAHKDTAMLLLESSNEDGEHAWDQAHGEFDAEDPADAMNSVPAAVATVNSLLGGNLSQDRISYEVMRGRMAGPERDLGWNDAYTAEQGLQAMAFAAGGATEFCSTNGGEVLAAILSALGAGSPVVAIAGEHPVAVSGYREVVRPPDPAQVFVSVHDPFLGPYEVDFETAHFSCLWVPPENAFPAFDEPEISTDTDDDGVVDFDEIFRFGTSPVAADTDRDGRGDKEDIAESVFNHEFGYAGEVAFVGPPLNAAGQPRDYDADGADPEIDCDADNDGVRDGSDHDVFSAPPVFGSFVSCGLPAVATLTWFTDTNLALWVLPNPAANETEALAQVGLPGYADRRAGWCNPPSGADDVPRNAVIGDFVPPIEPEARYIAVKFVDFCRRPPNGPDGDGPQSTSFALTLSHSSGRVEQIRGEVAWQTDDWRLYGPIQLVD